MGLAEATPTGYRERGRFSIAPSTSNPSWSHPIVTNGKLIIRDQDNIYAYAVNWGYAHPKNIRPCFVFFVAIFQSVSARTGTGFAQEAQYRRHRRLIQLAQSQHDTLEIGLGTSTSPLLRPSCFSRSSASRPGAESTSNPVRP